MSCVQIGTIGQNCQKGNGCQSVEPMMVMGVRVGTMLVMGTRVETMVVIGCCSGRIMVMGVSFKGDRCQSGGYGGDGTRLVFMVVGC